MEIITPSDAVPLTFVALVLLRTLSFWDTCMAAFIDHLW